MKSVYTLIKDHPVEIKELGSVGDVPGPLFFTLDHIPSTDLTSYGNATDQPADIQQGDGPVTVKSHSAGFARWAESGAGKVILFFSLFPNWKALPKVPMLVQPLKKDLSKVGATALIADAKALDVGSCLVGPSGLSKAATYWIDTSVKHAMNTSFYKITVKNAQIPFRYVSPIAQRAAITFGVQAKTIALLRDYIPISSGIAS